MILRQLARIFGLTGTISILGFNPVFSQEVQATQQLSKPDNQLGLTCCTNDLFSTSPQRRNFPQLHPFSSPSNLLVQTKELIRVTQVKLNRTEQGIEIILVTPSGEQLELVQNSQGNSFIVDIPGAQLQLPSEKPFTQINPSEGISQVTVTNRDENTIRLTAVGKTAAPQVELFDSEEGLIFALTPPPETREGSDGGQEAQTPPSQQPTQGEIISVTGVQLNPTETGIELILQTPIGVAELLQPNNLSSGNNFIVDIPNTQLQLPSGKPFAQSNPIEGISEISVINFDTSTIRVSATGETALPQVELFDSDDGLIFALTPPPPLPRGASIPPLQGGTQGDQIVLIDRIQLNPTETGFEVILLTPTGTAQQLRVVNVSQGNNFIAEIPNTQLQLPDGKPFRSENPAEGVSEVTVTNKDEKTVRVTAVGVEKQPIVELFDSKEGLIFSASTETGDSAAQGEDIELVVTGEQDGYAVPNASVGTRTDAELRDIPQSIQVVPRQVIEDQGADNIGDVLRNVSGVSNQGGRFYIRGFESTDSFLRDGTGTASTFRRTDLDLSNIEQVEVLKGPASVLYGTGEPGGTINLVTKQPLRDPAYEITGTIGNFDFYRANIDLTGPLNKDRTILYRLNAAYENAGSFVDFVERQRIAVFPVLSFQLGANTLLTLEGGYENELSLPDSGLPLEGTVLSNPLGEVPRDRFLGEPDAGKDTLSEGYVGYRLEHQFSDDWSLLNKFTASFSTLIQGGGVLEVLGLQEDNRTVERDFTRGIFENQNYILQTDVNGKVQTGIINHDLLMGVELSRNNFNLGQTAVQNTIDLFNPEYGNIPLLDEPREDSTVTTTHTIGIYAQNLLSIGEQVKILLGGRFDWFFEDSVDNVANTSDYTEANAFSPRVGIVYQPIEPVSLYASWSRSFVPEFGVDREGNPFEPTRGNQFEVGVRTELFERRLTATLAAYYITRQNDLITDPVDSNFSIQLGETRSQGIEFDIAGEPLPGLRLIANYAYTDAIVSEGDSEFEGNSIIGIPLHSGSFWVVYELQEGTLQGLGFGGGIRAVGEAEGDFENSFELPSYVRTDAVLYYRQDDWRVQLNIENLFDVEYFENNNRRYGQPFTIRGQVSVEF